MYEPRRAINKQQKGVCKYPAVKLCMVDVSFCRIFLLGVYLSRHFTGWELPVREKYCGMVKLPGTMFL